MPLSTQYSKDLLPEILQDKKNTLSDQKSYEEGIKNIEKHDSILI